MNELLSNGRYDLAGSVWRKALAGVFGGNSGACGKRFESPFDGAQGRRKSRVGGDGRTARDPQTCPPLAGYADGADWLTAERRLTAPRPGSG